MPLASVNGIELYYEDYGDGAPIVFCHEYAADRRLWRNQINWFSRNFRCIAYNGRGYPPSSVPSDPAAYGHDVLVSDLAGLLDALKIERAHIVGVAAGGGVALNFAIRHPGRVRSLCVVGAGAGSVDHPSWVAGAREMCRQIDANGIQALVDIISSAPQRQALRLKDLLAWEEFLRDMRDLSPAGCSLVMSHGLVNRKPFFDIEPEIAALSMPVLVAVGDQDLPAFESSVFLSRKAPHAALAVFPFCGHLLPVEEPALFNEIVGDFITAVAGGRWGAWRAGDDG